MPYIKAGYGFDTDCNFARAKADTPIELAPDEFAKPGYVIGYIAGDPTSTLGFMRRPRIRVHVQKSAVVLDRPTLSDSLHD